MVLFSTLQALSSLYWSLLFIYLKKNWSQWYGKKECSNDNWKLKWQPSDGIHFYTALEIYRKTQHNSMKPAKRMREQEFAEAYSPSEDQKPINKVNVQKQANDSNVKNFQMCTFVL